MASSASDVPSVSSAEVTDPASKILVNSNVAPFARVHIRQIHGLGSGRAPVVDNRPSFYYFDDRVRTQNYWGVVSVLVDGAGRVRDIASVAESENMERVYLLSVVKSLDFTPKTENEKQGLTRYTLPILVDRW